MKCPEDPESVADNYVMGWLNLEERDAYEEHLKECPLCVAEVKRSREVQKFVRRPRLDRGDQ